MKAALFERPNAPFRFVDMPVPSLDPGFVLVRIAGAGICGGDLHRYSGGIVPSPMPQVLGHQVSGVVERVGPGVPAYIEVGMRVAVEAFDSCGTCFFCLRGMTNLCAHAAERWSLTGNYYGGFAEFIPVPYTTLFQVPESVPLVEAASLTDAIATPYHAVRLADIHMGEVVAVFGIGDLGSATVQLAHRVGARVAAIDVIDEKLELARRLGAEWVINARNSNPVDAVKEVTEGMGADLAFEVAGRTDTSVQAMNAVRRGGRVILVGATDEPIRDFVTMPYAGTGFALARELTLRASFAMPRHEVQEVIALRAAGLIDTTAGLTVLPLDQIDEAFQAKARGELTRVILTP